MKQKVDRSKVPNTVVIESSELQEHLGKNKYIIYDEYYHELVNQQLLVRSIGSLHPVFQLNKDEDLLIVTGHYSSTFASFLKYRFKEYKLVSCNNIEWLATEAARKLICPVKCQSDIRIMTQIAEQIINQAMKEAPVIVFGANYLPRLASKYKNNNDNYEVIATPEDLLAASNACLNKSRGLMFLADIFRVGADIEWAVDAKVIIICPTQPDRESLI